MQLHQERLFAEYFNRLARAHVFEIFTKKSEMTPGIQSCAYTVWGAQKLNDRLKTKSQPLSRLFYVIVNMLCPVRRNNAWFYWIQQRDFNIILTTLRRAKRWAIMRTQQRMFAHLEEGSRDRDIKEEGENEGEKEAGIARGIFFSSIALYLSTMHGKYSITTYRQQRQHQRAILQRTTVVLLAK